MYFLALCPRQPGIVLDLFLCVALNSPSRNQNYPDSKEEKQPRVLPTESQSRTPERSPFPGVQGLCPLGFPPVRTPRSLCPATEPPPVPFLASPLPRLPECPLPGFLCPRVRGRGPLVNRNDSPWKCGLVNAVSPGPSGENQNPFLLPSLGLPEPSVIPLFIACLSQVPLATLLGGRDGPQAGRAGSLNGLGRAGIFQGECSGPCPPHSEPPRRQPPSTRCTSPWLCPGPDPARIIAG